MKTLHSGANEFPYIRTDAIAYDWKFEDAEDHEHPYILTVIVDGRTHSEGYEHDIGQAEASLKAERLAREVYEMTQAKS